MQKERTQDLLYSLPLFLSLSLSLSQSTLGRFDTSSCAIEYIMTNKFQQMLKKLLNALFTYSCQY